jgi:hypothetical protein
MEHWETLPSGVQVPNGDVPSTRKLESLERNYKGG